MKPKTIRLGLLLSLIAVVVLSTTSAVHAISDYTYKTDGWGNKVQIWINYSKYGGSVNVKATGYWIGFTFYGLRIGTPIFYGESISVRIYGYNGYYWQRLENYYSDRGWQFDKTFSFSLPSGYSSFMVFTTTIFDSIPFGHSTVYCNCYA